MSDQAKRKEHNLETAEPSVAEDVREAAGQGDRDRHERLWREGQLIRSMIEYDALAAYHREMARAHEAFAHHVVTQIWPKWRRDELTQYRLPTSTTSDLGSLPESGLEGRG